MRKVIACIALLAITCSPALAQNKGTAKLAPLTRIYLQNVEKYGDRTANLPGYVYKTINNKKYLAALIKVNAQLQMGALDNIGVLIGTKAGNIWTAQIPVEQVAAFTLLPGIEYVQLDEPMVFAMDSARVATHVDSVHAGINLPMPYTGKDVVVGIIDAGFDYGHPAFRDTTGTKFRVKRVWEQKRAGTAPAGFAYGNELTDSNAMWTMQTDNNTFSHGSHVAGISAGSGYSGDSVDGRYRGMAYESDIAFVGILPDLSEWINTGVSDVIDGLNYLYTYAGSVSKPCVANLSWGTTLGPHDGSSLFSEACDNLTGPGRIFALSAGNNGGQHLHLHKAFAGSDTLVNTQVNFDAALSEKRTWVDIWGDTGKTFCMRFSLTNGFNTIYTTTTTICLDDNIHNLQLIHNSDTCFITVTTSLSEFNQKPRAFIDINNKAASSKVVLGVAASDGSLDLWEGYVFNGHGYYGQFSAPTNFPAAMGGDADYTIGDIATTRSAITVAAYATKNIYTGLNNVVTNYTTYATRGDIAPFSSTGPTIDGRTKPDITAPGLILGSAVNSYDTSYGTTGINYKDVVGSFHYTPNNRDYSYGMMMGTSMSSPAATGIIALMLQANPQLNPTQVRAILNATAIQDNFTGVIPANGSTIWGGGKINAYRAVLDAANHITAVPGASIKNIPCVVFPNPNAGSFTIGYYSDKIETVDVEVQDLGGKKILTSKWAVTAGYNTKLLSLAGMAKGVYFTKLQSSTGSATIKTLVQ